MLTELESLNQIDYKDGCLNQISLSKYKSLKMNGFIFKYQL